MRILLTCLLIGCAVPARAMNWEGHDDWMADMAPALVLEQEAPHAVLLSRPQSRCGDERRQDVANPYEQIPIERPDCGAPREPVETER